jgi:methylmalonyl-CoA mutase cobalamin-binding domain/chain
MKSQERNQEILSELQDAVVQFDSDLVRQAARRALSARLDALDAITKGLAPGIECVVELYARGEYFLPELSMCVDTFFAGLDILRPHVRREPGGSARGTVVIGTVEGDQHDIGKNLVALLLEAAGFVVFDLGANVSPERFVQDSVRTNADLVCISMTLSTGLFTLPRIVDMLRTSNPKVRILVGGSAVSPQQALRWGVDGYAPDACSIRRTVTHLTGLTAAQRESAPASE